MLIIFLKIDKFKEKKTLFVEKTLFYILPLFPAGHIQLVLKHHHVLIQTSVLDNETEVLKKHANLKRSVI